MPKKASNPTDPRVTAAKLQAGLNTAAIRNVNAYRDNPGHAPTIDEMLTALYHWGSLYGYGDIFAKTVHDWRPPSADEKAAATATNGSSDTPAVGASIKAQGNKRSGQPTLPGQ